MQALITYIRGSIEELNHVRWPTRQQAVRLSLIVLAFVIVSSAVLGVIDVVLTQAVTFILT